MASTWLFHGERRLCPGTWVSRLPTVIPHLELHAHQPSDLYISILWVWLLCISLWERITSGTDRHLEAYVGMSLREGRAHAHQRHVHKYSKQLYSQQSHTKNPKAHQQGNGDTNCGISTPQNITQPEKEQTVDTPSNVDGSQILSKGTNTLYASVHMKFKRWNEQIEE